MDGEDLGLIENSGAPEGGESGGDGGEETTFIEGETETETETPEGGEGGGAEKSGESEEGERGRALPVQLRQALRALSEQNPEFAKKFPRIERQLTAALFKAGQADKMGGLPALRSAVETIEAHGGPEGIRELAETAEASRVLEEGMNAGDPVLASTWSESSPEGYKAFGRPYLEKLESMDLAAHDYTVAPDMVRTLTRTGVYDSMADLETAIAGEKFEDVQRHFQALKKFFLDLRQFGSSVKGPDPLKAERDRFDQERQQFATEQTKTFYGGVRGEVNTQVMAYTNRLLRQELHGRKIRLETANRLRKQINEDLAEAVNTAEGYADRYKAVMKQNDHGKAVQFITAAARTKLPVIVKRVLRDFNLAGGTPAGGPRRAVLAGGRGAGTPATVAGRPKTSEVDFSRTDKTAWLGSLNLGHGEAWRKDGKKAKW
jgi:hypothetical protein